MDEQIRQIAERLRGLRAFVFTATSAMACI